MSTENTTVELTQEERQIEQEAIEMGWDPNHKGPRFIPAAEFVDRGRQILPIVQATNARLKGEIDAAKAREQALANEIKAIRASQEVLEEAREADLAEARAAAKLEAQAELAAASEADDHAGVARATAKLTDLTIEDRDAKAAAAAAKKGNGSGGDAGHEGEEKLTVSPHVKNWLAKHLDFAKDPEKIALANVYAAKRRQGGDTRTDESFLDDIANDVEKRLGGSSQHNRMEGGGASGGGAGGGTGKSYADLPPEAKAACDRNAARLVGPGRAHKDMTSWQRAYATKYFAEAK